MIEDVRFCRRTFLVLLPALLGLYLRFIDPMDIADLKPRPDALEYVEGARNLSRGEGYWLEIDGKMYTPRYPPGFSVTLSTAEPFVGSAPGAGVRVVLGFAILNIMAAWLLADQAGGLAAGLAAGMVVALSTLDIEWSRYIMSDVPSAAMCAVIGAWCLGAASRSPKKSAFAMIGVVTGLAASLRLSNLVIAVPVVVVATFELWSGERAPQRAVRAVATILGVTVGLIPLGIYNFERFGSAMASGYGLWGDAPFALRYIWTPPLGSHGLPNGLYYPKLLFGFGGLFPWPIAILAASGIVIAWRSNPRGQRLVVFSALLLLLLLSVHLPFFWQADRFLLPALPFLAACSGQAFSHSGRRTRRIATVGLLALGLCSQLRADQGSFDASSETRCLREIDSAIEPNSTLILHTNVFLFRDYLRMATHSDRAGGRLSRVWVPVGSCEHRRAIRRLGIAPSNRSTSTASWIVDLIDSPFDTTRVSEGVRRLLSNDGSVYYATANREFEVRYSSQLRELLRSEFELTQIIDRELCRLFAIRPKQGVRRSSYSRVIDDGSRSLL